MPRTPKPPAVLAIVALAVAARAPAGAAPAPGPQWRGSRSAAEAPDPAAAQWPQWRGPLATGAAPAADPPLRFGEAENLAWKVEVPGRGHASPVVWGDRVYLLTAVPVGTDVAGSGFRRRVSAEGPVRFEVLALDRATGATVWRRTATERRPHEGTHPDGTWASASPVTDGRRVFAHFGSRGLYAYDAGGELLWQRELGEMTTRLGFGEGSSPALWGDTLVVNWDHEGDSSLVALDAASGRELWRRPRDEITSWSTPLVLAEGGRPQVVVSATGRIRGYDLATGEELWRAGGMTVNTVPTPVYGEGLLFAASGFRGNALKAIRLAGARGELDGTDAVAWSHDRDTPYVPSPLVYRGVLYVLKQNSGILTALDAASGRVLYGPRRLPGVEGAYASPVAAAGRVYVAGRNGAVVVLAAGGEYRVLAENRLDEGFDASPALAGRDLFLRGRRHLYRLTETDAAGTP